MFRGKRPVVLLSGLAAIALSACGTTVKPVAGTIKPAGTSTSAQAIPGFHGQVLDPRRKHVACLRAHGIAFTEPGPDAIQVGVTGVGPYIYFWATAGAAQEQQIKDAEQSAEVIGAALLYPNAASGQRLSTIEACTAVGVSG